MSSATTFFIEFKKNKDQRWRLLEAFVSEGFLERAPGDREDSDSTISTTDGAVLRRMNHLWSQGPVRDLFNDHDTPFCDRGFPADPSPRLQAIFDREQERIDQLRSDGYSYPDWRCRKSWCSLDELVSYLDARLDKCKASILSEHTKQLSSGVSEKLDEILSTIRGERYEKNAPEDSVDDSYDDTDEMLSYFMDDELSEIICLKDFADGIALLADFLTGDWGHEIRLVYYTS